MFWDYYRRLDSEANIVFEVSSEYTLYYELQLLLSLDFIEHKFLLNVFNTIPWSW